MKKHIYDEKNGLHYTLHGDVYLPDLVYSNHEYPPLGKYGRMRKTYLQEHHKASFSKMLLRDELWPHLLEVDEQSHEMMDTIVERMKQECGITEQLKADDWWRWVQEMGNIRNAAEEYVLREIVFQ
ncbi:MAG: TnpV protein [Clostridia bacterium]|nr:TnpV protein [Clostridia bacterium]